MRKLDTQAETKVVALLARGDSYQNIVNQLAEEGINVTPQAIAKVKERNTEALNYMKERMIDHAATRSQRILEKARNLVENRLDEALDKEKIRSDALRAYVSGEIEEDEYKAILNNTGSQISLKDLITASKEFFNQSQIEAGKPTSITENPQQAKENLNRLLSAINSGDEKAIAEAIFLDV